MRRNRNALFLLGLCISMFILVTFLNKFGYTLTSQATSRSDNVLVERNLYTDKERNLPAEVENIGRTHHLRQHCKLDPDRRDNNNKYLDYLIVNEKYKTVFCYIPKISCSQWKTIFITLTGKVNSSKLNFGNVHTTYQRTMNFLSNYPQKQRQRILQEYKKYMVVRNPLERLLSAYRNKLAGKGIRDISFREAGKLIVKRYRDNATEESLKYGDDVTFLEFVRFLTDDRTKRFNDHWERYTTLCRPCHVNYDFVGKYETINRDADYILKDMGVPPNIRFPSRSEKYSTIETVKTFDKHYSQIPPEYIQKLYTVYQKDFDLFGYSLSDSLNISSILK